MARKSNLDRSLNTRVAIAQWLYWARGKRPDLDQPGLFADPAWDILLDVYLHAALNKRVSITSACIASRVPPTTALRWINTLCQDGWTARIDDSVDKRRAFIELTAMGRSRLDAYFDQILDRLRAFFPAGISGVDDEMVTALNAKIEKLIAMLQFNGMATSNSTSQSAFNFNALYKSHETPSEHYMTHQRSDDDESESETFGV